MAVSPLLFPSSSSAVSIHFNKPRDPKHMICVIQVTSRDRMSRMPNVVSTKCSKLIQTSVLKGDKMTVDYI